MNTKWWTPISIGLILLSFILFAFLARKPLCIDSKVVEEIDSVSGETSKIIAYRCGLHQPVPYDEGWNFLLPQLSRRVQKVEKVLESWAPFVDYVKVNIVEKKPFFYKIKGHEVSMSEDLLKQNGSLEKALVKIWLSENANEQLVEDPLFEESLSDLLLFAVDGDLENGEALDLESFEKWPFVVKSLGSYCQSPWRQFEHLQLCNQENLQKNSKDSRLIPLSLRPLISQSMIQAYLQLSGLKQKEFLEALPGILRKLEIQDADLGFSSMDVEKQSFVNLSFELTSLLKTLQQGKNPVFKTWLSYFDQQFQRRGFSDQLGQAQLDHLVVLQNVDVDHEVRAVSRSSERFKDLSIAVVNQDQIYLLPEVEPLKKNIFGRIRAQRMTLVTCGPSTISDIDRFSEISTRLYLVEVCGDKLNLNYDGLVKGEIESFALANPSVSFVEIHLPSLHLALQKRKIDPSLKLAMNFSTQTNPLFKGLGWQEPQFDEGLKAFRAHSEIEAFLLYRPKAKLTGAPAQPL